MQLDRSGGGIPPGHAQVYPLSQVWRQRRTTGRSLCHGGQVHP